MTMVQRAAALVLLCAALFGVEGVSEHELLSRLAEVDTQIRQLKSPPMARTHPSNPLRESVDLLQREPEPEKQKRTLSVSAGFAVQRAQIGEGASTEAPVQDQGLKDLQDEIQALKIKVRAAETGQTTEEAFEQQQAAMKEKMLEQKLQSKLKQKELELDSEATRKKRELDHQLQNLDLQTAAEKRAEGDELTKIKIRVDQEKSKAEHMSERALEEKKAASDKAIKQDQALAEMRANAEAMESELEDMERSNLELKSSQTAVAANVKHAQQQQAKLNAEANLQQSRATEAEKKLAEKQTDLKGDLAAEAKLKASAANATSQSEVLTKTLAQEQSNAAGVRQDQALVNKMSAEVMQAQGELHRDDYEAAAKTQAIEAEEKRAEQQMSELKLQEGAATEKEHELQSQGKVALEEVEKRAQQERAVLKRDMDAEVAELQREMKAEQSTDKQEEEALKQKLNQTEVQFEAVQQVAKQQIQAKTVDDKIKREKALQQVEEATSRGAAEKIKAEYAAAMQNVNTIKTQSQQLELDTHLKVKAVKAKTHEELQRIKLASQAAIKRIAEAAQTKVGAAVKLAALEKAEEHSEQSKIATAGDEATAHEHSAIARAMAGEQEAVEDAVKEAIHFAQAKAQELTKKSESVLTELGRVIASAGTAKATEDAGNNQLASALAVANAEKDKTQKAANEAQEALRKQRTDLEHTHSELGTTALKLRKVMGEVVKKRGEFEQFDTANKLLSKQLSELQDSTGRVSVDLHKKLKLRDALKKQLELLDSQLGAANRTEGALGKLKDVKQEQADEQTGEKDEEIKDSAMVLDSLQKKQSELQAKKLADQPTAQEKPQEEEAKEEEATAPKQQSMWSKLFA